jgi:hypothetical protein
MHKAISFTPTANKANKQLDRTLAYIQYEFGTKPVNQFLDSLGLMLDNIAQGFISHRYFNSKKQIRYFILKKKNYILYKESKTIVKVVGIYSTKQNILAQKR